MTDIDVTAVAARRMALLAQARKRSPSSCGVGPMSDATTHRCCGHCPETMCAADAQRLNIPELQAEVERLTAANETLTDIAARAGTGWRHDRERIDAVLNAHAHLEAKNRALRAERDAARDEAQTLTVVLDAILAEHATCDASWCRLLQIVAEVGP